MTKETVSLRNKLTYYSDRFCNKPEFHTFKLSQINNSLLWENGGFSITVNVDIFLC